MNIKELGGPKTNKNKKIPKLDISNMGFNYHNQFFGNMQSMSPRAQAILDKFASQTIPH